VRPSVYDKDQPHHVVSREDEYGTTHSHCKCGWWSPYNSQGSDYRFVRRGDALVSVNVLHEHIRNNFDGRCHYKYRGMECGRFYGHRGIHREVPPPPKDAWLKESILAARARIRDRSGIKTQVR